MHAILAKIRLVRPIIPVSNYCPTSLMTDWNLEIEAGQSGDKGLRCIAVDENHIRFNLFQDIFDPIEDVRGNVETASADPSLC